MKPSYLLFIIPAIVAAIFMTDYFCAQPPETNNNLITQTNFLNDNKPVHLPGCQTYQRPIPRKVIYQTVRKDFVTRLCALEVPPPYGVIVMQREAQKGTL